MAYSSIREFTKQEQHTSILCQALAHPARLRIITKVGRAEGKMLDFQSIAADIPLSPPTVAQHINYLRKRKVLILGKSGAQHVYRLNTNMPLLLSCINGIVNRHEDMDDANVEEEVNEMGLALM